MEERRRNKRLELLVTLQLDRIDVGGETSMENLDVNVMDLSKSGMGFFSERELEIGSYYDTKLQIWTKEVIDAVIEIARREKEGDRYRYGAYFIGMTDADSLKIDIYRMFCEADV